jgi:hypothetical protein
MAVACGFSEANFVLSAPPGMEEDCDALQVLRMEIEGRPVVVSAWKVTADELAEINRTGRIWLILFGQTMPPACVCGEKPFSVEG